VRQKYSVEQIVLIYSTFKIYASREKMVAKISAKMTRSAT